MINININTCYTLPLLIVFVAWGLITSDEDVTSELFWKEKN